MCIYPQNNCVITEVLTYVSNLWKKVSVYTLSPTIHKKVSFHSLASLSLISPFKFASQKAGKISLLHLLVFIRLLIRLKYLYNSLTFIFLLWWIACLYFCPYFFPEITYTLFNFKIALYTTNTLFLPYWLQIFHIHKPCLWLFL